MKTKYSSRGAQLYRAHVEKEAQRLQKKLGSKLFDGNEDQDVEVQDKDFFKESHAAENDAPTRVLSSEIKSASLVKPTSGTLLVFWAIFKQNVQRTNEYVGNMLKNFHSRQWYCRSMFERKRDQTVLAPKYEYISLLASKCSIASEHYIF